MSDTERLTGNRETAGPEENRGGDGDAMPAVSEREAYFQALRIWIQQAQMYHNLSSCFPYYMMTFQGLQNNPTNVPLLNNNYQFQGQQFPFQVPNPPRNVPENQPQAESLTPAEGMVSSKLHLFFHHYTSFLLFHCHHLIMFASIYNTKLITMKGIIEVVFQNILPVMDLLHECLII